MRLADFDFDLPPDRIAQHPARPRDAARLLHVGARRAGGSHGARSAGAAAAGRRAGGQRHAGDPGAARRAAWRRAHRHHAGPAARRTAPGTRWRAMRDGCAWATSCASTARRHLRPRCWSATRTAAWCWRSTSMRPLRRGAAPGGCARPAAVHRAARRPAARGQRRLPDHLRRARRRGGRADRRAAFHAGAARRRWSGAACRASRSRCMSAPARSCRCAPTTSPQHRMHAERGEITPQAAAAINAARAAAGAWSRSAPPACACWRPPPTRTDASGRSPARPTLFILPGYRFRAVDLLLTNFHLPRSTLFMLVCAFAGTERMRAAYAHAIEAGLSLLLLRRCVPAGGGAGGGGAMVRRSRVAMALLRVTPPTAPRGPACCNRAWRGADAGLHAGRHRRHGEGDDRRMRCARPAPPSCSATPTT